MNRSGTSVQAALAFFKIPVEELLVVHDELDLGFGDIRLKKGGGVAGHNGLKSISEQLGTPDYARLRVGIGKPPPGFRGGGRDFVLEGFRPAEKAELGQLVGRAADAVELVAKLGLAAAMNTTNRR
jgi:PTH1 family peptidyl-tRNA hydrolase